MCRYSSGWKDATTAHLVNVHGIPRDHTFSQIKSVMSTAAAENNASDDTIKTRRVKRVEEQTAAITGTTADAKAFKDRHICT